MISRDTWSDESQNSGLVVLKTSEDDCSAPGAKGHIIKLFCITTKQILYGQETHMLTASSCWFIGDSYEGRREELEENASRKRKMGLLAAIAVNVVGGGAIYLTGGLATGLVAPMLGFGSAGIAAGSTAAAAQAYYGNLVAGSVISQLTAAAMVAPTP